LQLDREVTLVPGRSYAVAVQITNPAAATADAVQTIVTVNVQGVAEEVTTDSVTLIQPLTTVPQQWDLYSFGETNKVVKPFRVLSISRDQDLRRKITCLEYIEAIYNEASDIPEIPYSQLETTIEVSSVSVAEETFRQKDGTTVSNLNISWLIPRNKLVRGYKIFYSTDEGQTWHEWGAAGMTALSASIPGVRTQTTYLVKVCAVSYAGVVSPGVTAHPVYVTGKDVPPSDVAGLKVTLDPADLSKVHLSWLPVSDVDLAGYRIREGTAIIENLVQMTAYTYTAAADRLHSFRVTAVDNSGNESATPATANITPAVYPAVPTGFTALQNGDHVQLRWNKNSASDIAGYEIRQGSLFNNGSLVQTGITGGDLIVPVNTETTYRYHIKAINNAGRYSEDVATAEVTIYGLTPKNVILTFDEMMLQSGTHTNTEFGLSQYTCLTFPGLCSDYPTVQCNQVGGSVVLKLQDGQVTGEYLAARKDLGDSIKVNLAADFISTALLSAGNSAALWFRHSRDGETFEDWKAFAPVALTTRCLDFKVILESMDQTNSPIEVGVFNLAVDVDDVEKTGSAIIPAGGTTVHYGHTFLGGQGPDNMPVFTPMAMGAGVRAEVISAGLTSAEVKVVNALTGTDVPGTITYRVKGYGG
ncbi:fibronectin type III domain-containing protein, partial [Acetonema longum]|uniref:fibronectin type III domain-containing protein n=1 Tax=Acetonema longum TaxID=2374 RepID=UPI00058CB024